MALIDPNAFPSAQRPTPPSGPRVVGVDLSLTSTGLADSHGRTERVRTKAASGLQAEARRLLAIAGGVSEFAEFSHDPWGAADPAELVVIEGPSFASTSGQQHTRGGLWWITVVAFLTGPMTPVLSIPPTVLKTYATGKGNADKDAVLAAVVKRYPDWDVTGNDVADAVILAAIGSRLLGHPIDDLPKTHLRALDKVALP